MLLRYDLLSEDDIRRLIREEELQVPSSNIERIELLNRYGEIVPSFVEKYTQQEQSTYDNLTPPQMRLLLTSIFGVTLSDTFKNLPLNYMGKIICFKLNIETRPVWFNKFIKDQENEVKRLFLLSMNPMDESVSIDVNEMNYILCGKNKSNVHNISKLSKRITSQLLLVYNCDNIDDIQGLPIHPLDAVIRDNSKFTTKQLCDMCGMIIPPLIGKGNARKYVISNLPHYRSVFTRKTYTSYEVLTDKELFQVTNVYIPYTSREELINGMTNIIANPGVFVPLVRDPGSIINKLTLLDGNVLDENLFVIGYGRMGKYYCYEIEELIAAFHRDPLSGKIKFRKPHNTKYTFNSSDIEQLRTLALIYNKHTLVNHIDLGLTESLQCTNADKETKRIFDSFTDKEKKFIKDFLYTTFYAGMYMRRWKGPGYPYPELDRDTRDQDDPNDIVVIKIEEIKDLLSRMTASSRLYCETLPIYSYDINGELEIGKCKLKTLIDNVYIGSTCIRMASARFVTTSYRALWYLYNERIPKLNISSVERIV